ncbi:hypothetical protein WJX74_005124 [Apatococcus lobatus]|uniref:Uncharacterized protein n=1 Tax=Apatococcus lobatus TaxID=904363 RepID=A0AAW1QJD3_9CHLO
MSNLASQLADMQGSLEIGTDESQSHPAPLKSQPSALASQSKPGAKLSKRTSVPSDVLRHMASDAEALTNSSTLAHQPTLGSQGGDFANSMSGLGPRSFTELVQRAKLAEVAKKGTGLSHKPKNQNLLEVMARNKGAKVRTVGWLLGVIEQLYTEVEVRQRKMGDSLAIAGKISMPDITFAYFLQKYGRKNLVDEYVGSLVNTLERFREEDARLATFDEFLSEHWDIGIVLGYLQGSNLALQAAVVPCIDYPARTSEANAQPFICLRKASFIADAVLGIRNEKTKERFLQILKLSAVQASEADMQWFFASSETPKPVMGKGAPKTVLQQMPKASDMYKLTRSKFLQLLCTELHRIEASITAALPAIWNSMQGEEGHPTVQADILGLLARSEKDLPETARQGISLDLILEEFMKAATQLPDGSDTAAAHVSLDGFMTASMTCQVLRDSIRVREVKPALLPGEAEDADESPQSVTLAVVVLRHFDAMLTAWLPLTLEPSPAASKHQSEIQKLRAERGGVAKLKGYVALLQSLMATCFQFMLSTMLEPDTAPDQVEVRLCRAEDAVLVLMGNPYLVADPALRGTSTGGLTSMGIARTRRLAPPLRVGGLAAQAAVWRQLRTSQEQMAALIVQHKWRLIVQERKAKQMLSDVQRASISSLSPRHQGREAQAHMLA